MSTLTLKQARELAAADDAVSRAKRTLEEATRKQRELRSKLRHLVPVVDDDRGVLEQHFTGGAKVRVTPVAGHQTFSFSGYLKSGGRVTKTMAPHLGESDGYDLWTVTGFELPAPRPRPSSRRPASRRRSAAATA